MRRSQGSPLSLGIVVRMLERYEAEMDENLFVRFSNASTDEAEAFVSAREAGLLAMILESARACVPPRENGA